MCRRQCILGNSLAIFVSRDVSCHCQRKRERLAQFWRPQEDEYSLTSLCWRTAKNRNHPEKILSKIHSGWERQATSWACWWMVNKGGGNAVLSSQHWVEIRRNNNTSKCTTKYLWTALHSQQILTHIIQSCLVSNWTNDHNGNNLQWHFLCAQSNQRILSEVGQISELTSLFGSVVLFPDENSFPAELEITAPVF